MMQPIQRPKQAIPLSVTVIIVVLCLMTVSFTMTNRLLSSSSVRPANLLSVPSTILSSLGQRRQIIDLHSISSSITKGMDSPLHTEDAVRQLMKDRFGNVEGINPKTSKSFILYRAIGNDLPPRHSEGQTYDNVQFILAHEKQHDNLDVRWFVNRLVDTSQLLRLVQLLLEYNASFVIDYFDWSEFSRSDYRLHAFRQPDVLRSHIFRTYSYSNYNERRLILDSILRDRNQIIIQNNPVRNKMLELGISAGAKYVLPWDGNCFITPSAWRKIQGNISTKSDGHKGSEDALNMTLKYFYTPMARVTNNSVLLADDDSVRRHGEKKAIEEPQLIFRNDASERFNETIAYGCRPKVDMLVRLRVPGNWTNVDLSMVCLSLTSYPNDSSLYSSSDIPTGNHSAVHLAGWVARLFSGKKDLEKKGAIIKRGLTRTDGVEAIIGKASFQSARALLNFIPNMTTFFYNQTTLYSNLLAYRDGGAHPKLYTLVSTLLSYANNELTTSSMPTSSTTSTSSVNTNAAIMGSELNFNFVSPEYSREHIARYAMIHTLAGLFSGEQKYLVRARVLIVNLFLDQETRVPEGIASNIPPGAMVCVALDAVKLLTMMGMFKGYELETITHWTSKRAAYYDGSNNNMRVRDQYFMSRANATFIELNAACTSGFHGDEKRFMRAAAWARPRLWMQYPFVDVKKSKKERAQGDGRQDGVFGLLGWALLAQVGAKVGVDVWAFGQLPIHGGLIVLRDAIRNIAPAVLHRDFPHSWGSSSADDEPIPVLSEALRNELHVNSNATVLQMRPSTQRAVAEYVYWQSMQRYREVRGGFWGDRPGTGTLNVAESVYEAGHCTPQGGDDDELLLVPPFWNVAM